ncbi:MAG: hypothetical protein IKM97_00105 [Clostridia bacterium]|nr:hypothetical protein [Clostridia bacterium]
MNKQINSYNDAFDQLRNILLRNTFNYEEKMVKEIIGKCNPDNRVQGPFEFKGWGRQDSHYLLEDGVNVYQSITTNNRF